MTHKNCIASGSATCGTGSDKIGQSYWVSSNYCAAVGTPGTDSTYSEAMAAAAAAAGPQPNNNLCSNPPCTGTGQCSATGSTDDSYYVDLTDTGGPCYVWTFISSGSGKDKISSGYVHSSDTECDCPTSSDPTWD